MDSAPLERGLSVVVPVYNAEGSLPELIDRLEKALPTPIEAILVDDGSRDGSWDAIVRLSSQKPWVHGIRLMRNYGQHNALVCGARAAKYDTTLTIDDDLQHPPEEAAKLLARLAEGHDVVYGTPENEKHRLWRAAASQMTKLALRNAMGAKTARSVSAFRAFRTRLRDAFRDYRSPFVSLDVVLTWGTTRFSAVPVRHDPRTIGTSNYTFGKLAAHALNMMTGFSTVPLRLASILGLLFSLLGLAVLVFVVGRTLIAGSPVQGFPFLASTIAIFSGVQLFALGIIGEYLARVHFRLMERPTYTVGSTTAHSPP